MATTEQLQARIDEAEAAYHKLMLGGSVRRIQHEGRVLENTPANQRYLAAYIADLKRQLAGLPVRRGGIVYVQPV